MSEEEDNEIEMAEEVDGTEHSGQVAGSEQSESGGDEKAESGNMISLILVMTGLFLLAQLLEVAASPRYIDEGAQAFGEDERVEHTPPTVLKTHPSILPVVDEVTVGRSKEPHHDLRRRENVAKLAVDRLLRRCGRSAEEP